MQSVFRKIRETGQNTIVPQLDTTAASVRRATVTGRRGLRRSFALPRWRERRSLPRWAPSVSARFAPTSRYGHAPNRGFRQPGGRERALPRCHRGRATRTTNARRPAAMALRKDDAGAARGPKTPILGPQKHALGRIPTPAPTSAVPLARAITSGRRGPRRSFALTRWHRARGVRRSRGAVTDDKFCTLSFTVKKRYY